MRICDSCKREDRLIVDLGERCTCRPGSTNDEDASSHIDTCPKLIHEVREWMRLIRLPFGTNLHTYQLPQKQQQDGWKLKIDGQYLFRYRMLCRGCIQKEEERLALERDYKRACAKLRGDKDLSYNRILMTLDSSNNY